MEDIAYLWLLFLLDVAFFMSCFVVCYTIKQFKIFFSNQKLDCLTREQQFLHFVSQQLNELLIAPLILLVLVPTGIETSESVVDQNATAFKMPFTEQSKPRIKFRISCSIRQRVTGNLQLQSLLPTNQHKLDLFCKF